MEKSCVTCNIEMKKAFINTGMGFVLQEAKKGFGAKVSSIDAYVCPKCGRIEFFAEKPEIFDK